MRDAIPVTLEEKTVFVDAKVTLDGHPAKIGGLKCAFATVATIGRPSYSVEFSWFAVRNVINNKGGKFES